MTAAITISVGGGKGGVGKSVVAANLALALADLGFRTVLVDADLGAANLHSLLGLDRPGLSLQALLDRRVSSIEELVRPTGASRLFLVPGVGAVPGAANIAHAQKLKIIRHIRRLDTDFVVIDVGAGVSYNVLDLFELGDHRLVVTSPQLPAMQNAYCFLKASVYRMLRRRLDERVGRETATRILALGETERIAEVRARARGHDPALEALVRNVTSSFGAQLVGNLMESPGQVRVLAALRRMAEDFLELQCPVAASLPMSRGVHDSVTRRRPVLLAEPSHPVSRALQELSEQLATSDVEALRAGRAADPKSASPGVHHRETGESILGVDLIDYLRVEERVPMNNAARAFRGGRVFRARVEDLSPRGALVSGPIEAEIGDELQVAFVGIDGEPTLHGTIRHVSVSRRHFGIELSEASRALAQSLVREGRRCSSTLPPRRESVPCVAHA